MQKVLLADIVQFRLIEVDGTKIPIFVDEATPRQREEYHGVVAKQPDPLAIITAAPVPKRVLVESKTQNLKKKKTATPSRSKLPKPSTTVKSEAKPSVKDEKRKPENVRDLNRFSFGAISAKVSLREKAKPTKVPAPPPSVVQAGSLVNRVNVVFFLFFGATQYAAAYCHISSF